MNLPSPGKDYHGQHPSFSIGNGANDQFPIALYEEIDVACKTGFKDNSLEIVKENELHL